MKLVQAVRSGIFLCMFALYTFIFSILIMLTSWMPERVPQFLVTAWSNVTLCSLKVICGLSYKVNGFDKFKAAQKEHGGIVLMSKHESTLETIIFQSLLQAKAAFIVKKELLSIPFYGWAFKVFKPIAIDRNNKSGAMEQIIDQGSAALKSGRPVLIFPEGTRMPHGTKTVVKRGGVMLAQEAKAMIMPVAINTGLFWGRGQFIKSTGETTLSFCELIDPSDKEIKDLQLEIAQVIDQEIATF